jgi:hypothetical protein
MIDKSKLKNKMGLPLLKGLFYEEVLADKSSVVYTLKDEDHEGFPSLYRLYMETGDPTEYRFVKSYMSSLEHWERLCACEWFQPYIERWRRELELKLKSQALAKIMATSKAGGRDAFTASRFLVEKGWEPKEGQTKRGRPSKEEIAKATQEHLSTNQRLRDDAKRLGIQLASIN